MAHNTILNDRWVIEDAAGYLTVRRDETVDATTVDSLNAWYSAIARFFDEPAAMARVQPADPNTPTEYVIGDPNNIDNDNPWFVDPQHVKYLNGGSLETSRWARTEGSVNGIIRIGYTQTVALVESDRGKTITMTTDGDSGTLLGWDTTRNYLYIRPDSNAAANSFDDAPTTDGAWTISGGTGTGNQAGGASVTGNSIWTGVTTIGALADSDGSLTRIYLAQGGETAGDPLAILSDWPAGIGLNADGHLNVCILTQDCGQAIGQGELTGFARRYETLGATFTVSGLDTTRNTVIPIGTGVDLDNPSGYLNFTGTGRSGTFTDGEEIVGGTSGARGIITEKLTEDQLQYYLIGDTSIDFHSSGAETVTGQDSAATITSAAPVADGPDVAPDNTITVTHAAVTRDINNGAGLRPYSVEIDAQALVLSRVYERLKFITRRGETATAGTDGQQGQIYRGNSMQLEYDTQVGNFTEGLVVTGTSSGAFGVIVADHDDGATGDLILRDVIGGPFTDGEQITDTSTGDADVNSTTGGRVIVPVAASPFGTFAGGKFFGAPGVFVTDLNGADVQNYQLIDDNGTVQIPPNVVSITVSNLDGTGPATGLDSDRVTVLRRTGAAINLTQFTSHASNNAAGDTTFEVTTAIDDTNPTSSSIFVLEDTSGEVHRYTYTSKTATPDEFVLGPTDTGNPTSNNPTNGATTLTDTGATFQTSGILPGHRVRNATDGGVGVVTEVTSETVLTHTALEGGTNNDWETADTYQINHLTESYTSADTCSASLLDRVADATSETNSITYSSDIDVRVSVRQGAVIFPFSLDTAVTNTGLSVAAIRNTDSVAT